MVIVKTSSQNLDHVGLEFMCWICSRKTLERLETSHSVVLLKQKREKKVQGNLFTFFHHDSMTIVEILFKSFGIVHVGWRGKKPCSHTLQWALFFFVCSYFPSNHIPWDMNYLCVYGPLCDLWCFSSIILKGCWKGKEIGYGLRHMKKCVFA